MVPTNIGEARIFLARKICTSVLNDNISFKVEVPSLPAHQFCRCCTAAGSITSSCCLLLFIFRVKASIQQIYFKGPFCCSSWQHQERRSETLSVQFICSSARSKNLVGRKQANIILVYIHVMRYIRTKRKEGISSSLRTRWVNLLLQGGVCSSLSRRGSFVRGGHIEMFFIRQPSQLCQRHARSLLQKSPDNAIVVCYKKAIVSPQQLFCFLQDSSPPPKVHPPPPFFLFQITMLLQRISQPKIKPRSS